MLAAAIRDGMFCTMIVGIAGDVPAEMARRDPRLQVVAAAGTGADDDGELLAGVEILGAGGRGAGPRHEPKHKRCTAIPDHGRASRGSLSRIFAGAPCDCPPHLPC